MEWLKALYVATTIFGVGVTVADLIGAFSNMGEDTEGDGSDDATDGGETDGAIEFDGGDDAGGGDADAGDISDSDSGDIEVVDEVGDLAGEQGSLIAHDRRNRRNPVLAILTALRTAVYFSLGFGPVGWFATTQYPSLATTLLWSLPMGVVVAIGTRMLRSFMRRDLSSTITHEDLIMEKGVVTVSIATGQIGKVRVLVGGTYVDRFAKSSESDSLPVGAVVRVVDSDDEYVYVESEQEL